MIARGSARRAKIKNEREYMILKRTVWDDPDFSYLIHMLDKELWINYPHLQQQYVNKNIINTDASVIVCYDNGLPVGCGCIRQTDKEKTVELKRMYVDPIKRGKGIGSLILNELCKWAKEKGNTTVLLETGIKQTEAIEMYKKYRFEITENYGEYKGNRNSICMRKWL
jgi:putative acetyltransferase